MIYSLKKEDHLSAILTYSGCLLFSTMFFSFMEKY